jgi:hypothetical protein
MRQMWWSWTGRYPTTAPRPVQAAVEVAVVLVLTVVLPGQLRTRLWALALTVPMAWLSVRLLDVLHRYVA